MLWYGSQGRAAGQPPKSLACARYNAPLHCLSARGEMGAGGSKDVVLPAAGQAVAADIAQVRSAHDVPRPRAAHRDSC